jgi:Na+-translocating ferredoxin:NAD+ oxidoreductase RnfD subunit
MNVMGRHVADMYLWTIALLLAIDSASAYMLGTFPYVLIVSVAACIVLELAIRKLFLNAKNISIPYSAVITGLIIGSVAPLGVSLLPVLIACIVAVIPKFLLKSRGANIFNPAALGLVVGLGLFSIGSSWWATSTVNVAGAAISIAVILVIAAYESRRLVLAFSFIASAIVISIALSMQFSVSGAEVAILGVNYFFAFLMLTEPKTSPTRPIPQLVYGIYVAVLYFAVTLASSHSLALAQASIFIALLIGNATYAIYRQLGHKIMRRRHTGSAMPSHIRAESAANG